MSVIDLPSKESLVVSVGKAREKLESDRVSMNDKTAVRIEEKGACGDLVVPLVLCLLYLLYCLCLLCP